MLLKVYVLSAHTPLFLPGVWFLNLCCVSRAIRACLKVNRKESTWRQEPNPGDPSVLGVKTDLLRGEDMQGKLRNEGSRDSQPRTVMSKVCMAGTPGY